MVTEAKPWYKTKMPPSRVFQLDTDLDKLFDGLEEIGMGPRFIGEIRKGEWHLELGGPKHEYKSFVFGEVVKDPSEVIDGKIELFGPDMNEVPPETSLPFCLHGKMWGPELNEDHTEFAMRGMVMGWFFLEGCGWTGGPDSPWLRVSKKMSPKLSWKKLGQAMRAHVMTMCPIVHALEIKVVIGSPEIGGRELIEKLEAECRPKWEALMAAHSAIGDEDVDEFYGCTLCKVIAPNHACVVTPALVPYCGVLTYYTCKAIYAVDPHGYIFEVDKGETIDPIGGRFSGVDRMVYEKSEHRNKIFHLHSTIKYTTTN